MELKVWLLYALTDFLLIITPGPAVMLISAQGFKYGARQSYFGALGISAGNLLYFILSALGLATVILNAGNLFEIIKTGGAIYLIVTGFLMIYKSFKKQTIVNSGIEKGQNNLRSFLQAFITQTANPKAIIFFIALLPQFIDSTQNIALQFAVLAITTTILEMAVLMFYGRLAAHGKKLGEQNKIWSKLQDRLAGGVLMGLGINLLFVKLRLK